MKRTLNWLLKITHQVWDLAGNTTNPTGTMTLKNYGFQARDAEKKYLKWRGDNAQRNDLQHNSQYPKQFYKELWRAEKVYNAQQRDHIQQMRTDDPKRFWDAIKKLGPGNISDMSIDKVKLDDGSVSSDPQQIMNKWKHDFETLYQRSNIPDNATENDFLAALDQQRGQWQEYDAAIAGQGPCRDDLEEDFYLASLQLNSATTLQKTINALKQCKNGKATGIDNVPNEILKTPALQEILFNLFDTFETNKIPSMWYKGIIQPIPKRGKDPLFPLNHRGISLMSTVAKLYSAIINNRVTAFMEAHGLYMEEQNGFRRLRSCLDHLFTHPKPKSTKTRYILRFYRLRKGIRQRRIPFTVVQTGRLWNSRKDVTCNTSYVPQPGVLH